MLSMNFSNSVTCKDGPQPTIFLSQHDDGLGVDDSASEVQKRLVKMSQVFSLRAEIAQCSHLKS